MSQSPSEGTLHTFEAGTFRPRAAAVCHCARTSAAARRRPLRLILAILQPSFKQWFYGARNRVWETVAGGQRGWWQ